MIHFHDRVPFQTDYLNLKVRFEYLTSQVLNIKLMKETHQTHAVSIGSTTITMRIPNERKAMAILELKCLRSEGKCCFERIYRKHCLGRTVSKHFNKNIKRESSSLALRFGTAWSRLHFYGQHLGAYRWG